MVRGTAQCPWGMDGVSSEHTPVMHPSHVCPVGRHAQCPWGMDGGRGMGWGLLPATAHTGHEGFGSCVIGLGLRLGSCVEVRRRRAEELDAPQGACNAPQGGA